MKAFTVDAIALPIRSPFVTLSGTKDPTVDTVSVNSDSASTRFPTETTWEADLHLGAGDNRIEIQATDLAENQTEVVTLTLTLPKVEPETSAVFNPLDDKALEIMLERLPGEKNLHLKNRILDAEKNPGNATYEGLVRALSRELSLDLTEDAFTITPIEDTTARVLRATEAFLTIEPTRLLIEARELRKEKEKLRIDPGTGEGTLTEIPRSKEDLKLQGLDGKPLEQDQFELVDEKKVRLLSGSELLLASYHYLKEITITSSTTLSSLETSVEAVTGISGQALFTATVKSGEGAKRADRIVRVVRSRIGRDGLKLDLAQFKLSELANQAFRKSLLNSYGTHLETKLAAYAGISRSRGRVFLRDTVLDVDEVLEDEAPRQEHLALPHLFDPVLRWFRCSDPADTTRYGERHRARGADLCPVHSTRALLAEGHGKEDFRSGPGLELRMVKVS